MASHRSPIVRRLRHWASDCLRVWQRPHLNAPLSPFDMQGRLVALKTLCRLEARQWFTHWLHLSNLGSADWSSRGKCPVVLSVSWMLHNGEAIDLPPREYALPTLLRAGESMRVPLSLQAPEAMGDYRLRVELRQRPERWFREFGVAPADCYCAVSARARDDIDYQAFYAAQDLGRNYWLVVGPQTRADFDRLAQVKKQHLIDLGLHPDARILDVGCGTGLLAQALEGYLSDRGRYVGTDLAPQAIEFCQARYRRPNFHFQVNEPTTLPLVDETFDCIAFYSVFTHTYADETALLLGEAKRLLAPKGFVFADVFTSPRVERTQGHRGAIEWNLHHFLRLVALAGLNAQCVFSTPWQQHAERRFFRFVHRE